MQMGTFVGATAEYVCDVDLKIFGEPKRECTKRGVWTGLEPKCKSKFGIVGIIIVPELILLATLEMCGSFTLLTINNCLV